MLAYMVMPAVASLVAANDDRGARPGQVRRHPAAPRARFCRWACWPGFMPVRSSRSGSGDRLGYDAANLAPLMRFFLLAAIPLVLSVLVQVSIGLNKIKVIALAALAGSVVNLPISCYLTARLGVSGVIWGTVLTTLFSNLLVPGIYVFRELQIDLRIYLKRTLSAPFAGGDCPGRGDMGSASVAAGHLPGNGPLVAIAAAHRALDRRNAGVYRRVSADAGRSG